MKTITLTIESSLRSLNQAKPIITEITRRIREELGPQPRNAFTLAALRGLGLRINAGADRSPKLDGSDIVVGSQHREEDVLRELARWELRGIDHDEDLVLMLRDALNDSFCVRAPETRRHDACIVLKGLDLALDALQRSVSAEIARVRQLMNAAQHWADGGPVPASAVRFTQLANAAMEQLCSCNNTGNCRNCLANIAIGEYYTHFDIESTALRVFEWAQGRALDRRVGDTMEELLNCETLRTMGGRFFNELENAIEATVANGQIHDPA